LGAIGWFVELKMVLLDTQARRLRLYWDELLNSINWYPTISSHLKVEGEPTYVSGTSCSIRESFPPQLKILKVVAGASTEY
jgi:hypothetical protein